MVFQVNTFFLILALLFLFGGVTFLSAGIVCEVIYKPNNENRLLIINSLIVVVASAFVISILV